MEKIHILWTTSNKDTIFNMLSMYAINSKKKSWWQEVNVIIWGASAKLAGTDAEVQAVIREMIDNGISVEACKDCCDKYGVTAKMEELGIEVKYMGQPLTDYSKSGEKVLSI